MLNIFFILQILFPLTKHRINVTYERSYKECEINFNGSNLNSGIYFYILEADETLITKKMVLIK